MVAFHPVTPELVEPGWAEQVASPPLEALAPDELATLAYRQPWSILHAVGAASGAASETFGDADPDHLGRLRAMGAFRAVDRPMLLLYRLERAGHAQVGLVGDLEAADHRAGRLRRHEHTEIAKETALSRDREQLGVDTTPVSVAYPPERRLDARLAALAAATDGAGRPDGAGDEDGALTAGGAGPLVSVTGADGTRHQLWPITDSDTIGALTADIRQLDAVYLLDGHHRLAAATRHAERAAEGGGPADPSRVLAALFPRDRVRAMDYRRVIRHPLGLDGADLMPAIRDRFTVEPVREGAPGAQPRRRGEMSLRLEGRWHRLVPHDRLLPAQLPDRLDEAIVQRQLLAPVLGVTDPRTSSAISYVPGTVPLTALDSRLDPRDVVIVLHPLPLTELQAVADAGEVLPPKSTYFTPKLAAGLMVQRRHAPVPAAG